MLLVFGDHVLEHVRISADKRENITDSDYKVNLIRTKLRSAICALLLSLILLYVNLVSILNTQTSIL